MCISVKASDPPGTGTIDSCEWPCGYRELNPGPLESQAVLLNTKPSLQLPFYFSLNY